MLRKLRNFWKEWWPFLSSAPIAIYTVWAYFSEARNDIFLFARLFRWELLLSLLALGGFALVHLFSNKKSLLRPANSVRVAASTLRSLTKPGIDRFDRICAALLLVALVAFTVTFGHYAFKTYVFLHARYHHVDRQAMVTEAGKLEEAQDLPQAIMRYKQVLEEFPFNRFNINIEEKIAELEARQASWKAVSGKIRALDARWGTGKASTMYDQLLESCRFISNSEPCTRIGDYLAPVRKIMAQTQRPGASCSTIISQAPRKLSWIFLDPNDARWLGVEGGTGSDQCDALGLASADDLAAYLDKRWHLSLLAQQHEYDPKPWSWAFERS